MKRKINLALTTILPAVLGFNILFLLKTLGANEGEVDVDFFAIWVLVATATLIIVTVARIRYQDFTLIVLDLVLGTAVAELFGEEILYMEVWIILFDAVVLGGITVYGWCSRNYEIEQGKWEKVELEEEKEVHDDGFKSEEDEYEDDDDDDDYESEDEDDEDI